MSAGAQDVVEYWFGQPPYQPQGDLWWRGGKEIDQEIHQRFGALVEDALNGKLDHWKNQPESALALVILLDQFTRNMFRGSAQAFAGDEQARAIALAGIEAGYLERLHCLQAVFFCMPLEHSESMQLQDRCVAEIQRLIDAHAADPVAGKQIAGYLDHAEQHREIVARFGRFPHRNEALQRASTDEEVAYLGSGGKRFGQ